MERMSELATAAKISAGSGHSEAQFMSMVESGDLSDDQLRFALEKFRVYHEKLETTEARPKTRHVPKATIGNHVRVGPYIRAGLLPIEFVLANSGKQDVTTDLGVQIGFSSWRIACYAAKGVKCEHCGMEGTYFAAEKNHCDATERFHLNLYHREPNGKEVMMTVDHIFPKSKGGGNHISNLRPLCAPCNLKKADKVEDDGKAA